MTGRLDGVVDGPAKRRWNGALSRMAAALLAATFLGGASCAPAADEPQSVKPFEALTIVTQTGRHPFQVEVVRKPEELARGLMFRRSLPQDQGMLFDFGENRHISMWMRNTYIPLDMIFIAPNGRVVNVAENTEPLSETPVPSEGPALAVLEVNAGTAQRLQLRAGDRIEHPMFAPAR